MLLVLAAAGGYVLVTRLNLNPNRTVGEVIDTQDGVAVYYNGGVNNNSGRNLTEDGYNLGLRYQCVEFVKRYYWEHFHHRMPDTLGHAKDFFDPAIADGGLNAKRHLVQFQNGSTTPPEAGDIVVFDRWLFNPYGHVAIVAAVDGASIEIIQQNPGPFGSSRERLALAHANGHWTVASRRLLGWLRPPPAQF